MFFLIPLWFRFDSAMIPLWFRYDSTFSTRLSLALIPRDFFDSALIPLWFRYDSALIPLWFRVDSAFSTRLDSTLIPRLRGCEIPHPWFHYDSALIPLWFRSDSALIPLWFHSDSASFSAAIFASAKSWVFKAFCLFSIYSVPLIPLCFYWTLAINGKGPK